jgi:hypothetical protein
MDTGVVLHSVLVHGAFYMNHTSYSLTQGPPVWLILHDLHFK